MMMMLMMLMAINEPIVESVVHKKLYGYQHTENL